MDHCGPLFQCRVAHRACVSATRVRCGHPTLRRDLQHFKTHVTGRKLRGHFFGPLKGCSAFKLARPFKSSRVVHCSLEQASGRTADVSNQPLQGPQMCASSDQAALGAHHSGLLRAGAEVAEQVADHQNQTPSAANAASIYQPASLSRVFIGIQPGRGLARQVTKVGKPSGPMSLVSSTISCCGCCKARWHLLYIIHTGRHIYCG